MLLSIVNTIYLLYSKYKYGILYNKLYIIYEEKERERKGERNQIFYIILNVNDWQTV